LSGGNIIFSSAPNTGEDFFGVILAGADYVNAGANFPDGTLAAPSITFDQDNDTGYYRSGSGSVSFASNGVAAGTWSSAGLTAPALIPTGSSVPANGVYLPSTNSVAISSNAVQRVNFGTGEVVFNDGGENYDFRIEGDTNANLFFVDASTDRVGLGTSAPANVLEVAGNNSAENGIGNVQGILRIRNNTTAFGSSPTAGIVFATKYRTSPDVPLDGAAIYGGKENTSDANKSFFLAFATRAESGNNGNESMRIDSQGRLGIGVTGPQAKLDVRNSGNASECNLTSNQIAIVHNENASVGNQVAPGGFVIARDKASAVASGDSLGGIIWHARGTDSQVRANYASILGIAESSTTAAITFNTSSSSYTTTEQMRVTSTGELRFNSGYGSAAAAYGCRAWVNFNGTGTVAIRASGNVSSITDNGVSNYTVNFATAMVDANYAVTATAGGVANGNFARTAEDAETRTSSLVRLYTNEDAPQVNVAIFR
jgi:hypothetical protein